MTFAPLQLVEILERSDQGVTRPFLCRCEDDNLYYVKGRDAGSRSLLCEWLAGHLARSFGLPVPPFAIVQAPRSLVELYPEGSALGASPAFGSRVVAHVQELTAAHVDAVPDPLRRDVLVFDWWIRHLDRALSSLGGNPNLLWDADSGKLVVIDHNVAFDPKFSPRVFSETHVFAAGIPKVFHDLVEPARYAERLQEALVAWPAACQNVPDEWWFADEERTVPADFDPEATLALLNRCTQEAFWKLTT
ncbi:MAG: HipA family kinase [Gammaproteobacteria bacterium]